MGRIRKTRAEERREAAETELRLQLDRLDQEELKPREGCRPGWRAVASDPARPRKVHLTLWIDTDVARWFRQQGQGHQSRINAVLRAFMAAKQGETA